MLSLDEILAIVILTSHRLDTSQMSFIKGPKLSFSGSSANMYMLLVETR